MSVATKLGLTDPGRGLLAEAGEKWSRWCEEDPRLAVADGLLELQAWLLETVGPEAPQSAWDDADGVMHALARLASPRGGDDIAATAAVAYLLLPGASLLANRLRGVAEQIDQLVAAQLWLEIRAFKWERLQKVAANILWNTRREVLREARADQAILLDPGADAWQRAEARARTDTEDLYESLEMTWLVRHLLARAITEGVITDRERTVLLALAEAAADHEVTVHRGVAGLYSRPALHAVARQTGWSISTVRRRAMASIEAMADAYGHLPVAS